MDKASPLCVVAALSVLVAVPAGADPVSGPTVPSAQSFAELLAFAELLDPIPNAADRLRFADAQEAPRVRLIEAQYVPGPVDHHHHHSNY